MYGLYENKDGELANSRPEPIMITGESASALAAGTTPDVLADAKVGTVAYTAGWEKAWQLGPDGETWKQFIGG